MIARTLDSMTAELETAGKYIADNAGNLVGDTLARMTRFELTVTITPDTARPVINVNREYIPAHSRWSEDAVTPSTM